MALTDNLKMYGQRKFLNDNGYTDDQIGYKDGEVLLNNKHFSYANPQAADDSAHGLVKGSTYDTQPNLTSYLNSYRSLNGTPSPTNPAGELGRTLGQFSALLNDAGTNHGMLTDNLAKLNSGANAAPYQFKTPEKFSYSAENDPQYQAALALAKGNIQTAQNNTMANLIAHGQGDSSYSTGVAQQIADREIGNVNNNLLPQFIKQAYDQYQNGINNDYRVEAANYGAAQDQFSNRNSLVHSLADLAQNDITNQRNTQNDAFDRMDTNRKFDYETDPNNPLNAGRVTNNQIDAFKLKELQDPNSPTNQAAKLDLQMKQIDASSYSKENKLKLEKLQKEISEIGKVHYKPQTPEEIAYDKLQVDKITQEIANLKGKDTPKPQTASDVYKEIDSSPYISQATDQYGNKTGTTTVTNPTGLETYIYSFNLPNEETYKLLQRYGLVK